METPFIVSVSMPDTTRGCVAVGTYRFIDRPYDGKVSHAKYLTVLWYGIKKLTLNGTHQRTEPVKTE